MNAADRSSSLRQQLAALALALAACDDGTRDPARAEGAAGRVDLLVLRGAAIDGSEDLPAPEDAEPDAGIADEPGARADVEQAAREAPPLAANGEAPVDPQRDDAARALAAGVEAPGEPGAAGQPGAPAETAGEPEKPAAIGRVRKDGVREIAFLDLALEGLDPDEVIDSLLFPDDFPEQLVPQPILDLDGQRIAVTGYMIPGRIKKGGIVHDFLLVRDLLACCFGGMPKPDEWIDVVMAEGHDAEYHRYVPLTVTGTFSVGQDIDEESLAPPIFKLVATDVRRLE